MSYTFFFKSELTCEAIQVTVDTDLPELYFPSDERASAAQNTPVWKRSGEDLFIFNDGIMTEGWRIGNKETLTTGGYYCQGMHIFIIFNVFPKRSAYNQFLPHLRFF